MTLRTVVTTSGTVPPPHVQRLTTKYVGNRPELGRDVMQGPQGLISTIPVVAVMYNATLAILAVKGVPVNVPVVVACEVLIIFAAFAIPALTGFRKIDTYALAYLYSSVIIMLVMSLANENFLVDGLRNILIITTFTLLGSRASERTVRTVYIICAAVTLVVLIWEISALTSYAATFRPAEYLQKTRGYMIRDFYDEVGLSIGTMGYEGRFSFGIFSGPRTSSIFLEQVGINCFAIVIMVYLTTMWSRLGAWEKALFISTTTLIILSNNARMAAIVVPMLTIGYFVFPKLPRYLNVVIPVVLLMSILILFQFERPKVGDDLTGRLGVTYLFLSKMEWKDLVLGNKELVSKAFDTGYGYIVSATTIIGALLYWCYLSFIIPQDSVIKRRAAWSLNTYIYLWLMVGGTASFSMKTASLLWFMVGFVRTLPSDSDLDLFNGSSIEMTDNQHSVTSIPISQLSDS